MKQNDAAAFPSISCGNMSSFARPCGNDHHDEADIAAMSLLMTLHDIGFSAGEAQRYMRTDGQGQRMEMLERRREQVLAQIHHDERQLERIDWLRHQNRTAQEQ